MRKEQEPSFLEEITKLRERIESLGFKLDLGHRKELQGSGGPMKNWSRLTFIMEQRGDLPRRELAFSQHPEYGTHIAIFSEPWDEKYHFAISRPVTDEQALRMIEEYVQATNNGRRYSGK